MLNGSLAPRSCRWEGPHFSPWQLCHTTHWLALVVQQRNCLWKHWADFRRAWHDACAQQKTWCPLCMAFGSLAGVMYSYTYADTPMLHHSFPPHPLQKIRRFVGLISGEGIQTPQVAQVITELMALALQYAAWQEYRLATCISNHHCNLAEVYVPKRAKPIPKLSVSVILKVCYADTLQGMGLWGWRYSSLSWAALAFSLYCSHVSTLILSSSCEQDVRYPLHWNKQTNTASDHTQAFYLFGCSLHQENKEMTSQDQSVCPHYL